MYPSMITTVSADRLREWREQAARDRLVIQARRARRAAAGADLRRRPWSKWWSGRATAAVAARPAPADATPDQWASGLSVVAAERVGADDRQPVGGRAS